MTEIKLTTHMSGCPRPWQNFFDAECRNGPRDRRGDVTIAFINKKLKKFGGKYNGRTNCVEFTHASLANFWLLRYS